MADKEDILQDKLKLHQRLLIELYTSQDQGFHYKRVYCLIWGQVSTV